MEKKIVVMGAQDVAAMRRAHKEAEAAYFQAKVGALEFIVEEMTQTGREYTAAELSAMSGLSSGEIAVQLSNYCPCRAAWEAGVWGKVERGKRVLDTQFVRILPNGEIDPNQVMTIRRLQTVYVAPSGGRIRR